MSRGGQYEEAASFINKAAELVTSSVHTYRDHGIGLATVRGEQTQDGQVEPFVSFTVVSQLPGTTQKVTDEAAYGLAATINYILEQGSRQPGSLVPADYWLPLPPE